MSGPFGLLLPFCLRYCKSLCSALISVSVAQHRSLGSVGRVGGRMTQKQRREEEDRQLVNALSGTINKLPIFLLGKTDILI
ncbi:hypothetical protein BKA57DRAFT_452316 [Linnemannia elongata]|nr:hypothetical protein BKA57DRAFT_452316 [Linnemannia elongata]